MPNHHRSHHLHPSRPLDRGELEGLPALPLTPRELEADEIEREELALPSAPPRRSLRWPRYSRWMAEAGSFIALIGILFSLVTHTMRMPVEAGFSCPPGTSPAVRAATACRLLDESETEGGDE